MADRPDWEKAWDENFPDVQIVIDAATFFELGKARYAPGAVRVAFHTGYLAATAQLEAVVAKAKAEVLEELRVLANEKLKGKGLTLSPAEAVGLAFDELRFERYSEPTAVAATEKEG